MDKVIGELKKTKQNLDILNLSMLTSFEIAGNGNPFYGKMFDRKDIDEIEKETTIKHIYFDYTSFNDFNLLPNLNLISLGLNGCPIDGEFIKKLPEKYPNLKGLYVKDIKFDLKILALFKNLTELEVDLDDFRDILWLFSENRNLETVNGIDYEGNSYDDTASEYDDYDTKTVNSEISRK